MQRRLTGRAGKRPTRTPRGTAAPRRKTRGTRDRGRLSQKEWTEFIRQIWDIPIPNRGDSAFGLHPAIMPEEIPNRCIRMFTFEGDVVLDPFADSGTILKVDRGLGRAHVGHEIMEAYAICIDTRLSEASATLDGCLKNEGG